MKRSKKIRQRLEKRIKDYTETMNTKNVEAGGSQQRKDTGGYHRPGSLAG